MLVRGLKSVKGFAVFEISIKRADLAFQNLNQVALQELDKSFNMVFLSAFGVLLVASVSFASLQIVRSQDRYLLQDQADNKTGSRGIMDGCWDQRSYPGPWRRYVPSMPECGLLPEVTNRILFQASSKLIVPTTGSEKTKQAVPIFNLSHVTPVP